MSLAFPAGEPASPPEILGFRLIAGGIWVASILFAVRAPGAGLPGHQAWMLRALAVAIGSGTSAIVAFPL